MADLLTRAERIRLEALAQAQQMSGLPQNEAEAKFWLEAHERRETVINQTEERILARAERIEAWLRRADNDTMREAN